MKYRSEIDGLRAFAVIPVILYHAGFDLFKGGFIGVDIFFVISGYLITTIIYKEINAGTFLLCLIMLLVPSYIITRITPVKAIRFE